MQGTIYGINGPVVYVKGSREFGMLQTVRVGNERLMGEVIGITDAYTIVQVYESTTGLKPGEPVTSMGVPLSVTLGPGIIGNIFDGIERPLLAVEQKSGAFLDRGLNVPSLSTEKKWEVTPVVAVGDAVQPGDVIATVPETSLITHKIMVPAGVYGKVAEIYGGSHTITETIAVIEQNDGTKKEMTMTQTWPIRTPRPYTARKPIDRPLVTGQRIIDTLLPIAKGGTAAVPGGFGTGKTMTQHQLAKWCDADIIIYIGCGERGNEMTQVLEDFSKLIDPKSGRPLMDRTALIANTSNMPVAAREASIYTGITIAEYYRDMGYHVAIMADSTSRWAEALREISGRLEEMPAEEGFPAYLPSRLSEFYERAGYVDNFNGTQGSVSIIGAVSPQGGDFSEPVTQNTKRFIRCFWALDKNLAYSRHYPAINWIDSYSEYQDELESWYDENVGEKFMQYRERFISILQEESKLMEIVKLIGSDVLPDSQRLDIEIAKVIRVGYLQQNAFHAEDTCVPLEKQYKMMEVILYLYDKCRALTAKNIPLSRIKEFGMFEKLINIKYDVKNSETDKLAGYMREIDEMYLKLMREYE